MSDFYDTLPEDVKSKIGKVFDRIESGKKKSWTMPNSSKNYDLDEASENVDFFIESEMMDVIFEKVKSNG